MAPSSFSGLSARRDDASSLLEAGHSRALFADLHDGDADGRTFDCGFPQQSANQPGRSPGAEGAWLLVVPAAHLLEVFLQDLGIRV